MWIICGLMWITGKKLWITFLRFFQNVDMWITANFFPQVFHIAKPILHIGLIELYTSIHTPTTTTVF